MQIFRVAVSFMRAQMQYMHERGVFAMSPGDALDRMLGELNIHLSQVQDFKSFVSVPISLDSFGRDAMILTCIGSDSSLLDLWKRKHGD